MSPRYVRPLSTAVSLETRGSEPGLSFVTVSAIFDAEKNFVGIVAEGIFANCYIPAISSLSLSPLCRGAERLRDLKALYGRTYEGYGRLLRRLLHFLGPRYLCLL